MAFKKPILLVAVLLSILAATSASVFKDQCVPGRKIPDKLRACHGYVARQVCGSTGGLQTLTTEEMKERCCQELSPIPKYCRCEALRILMDQLETVDVEGGGRLKELTQKCPRQWQRGFAATLAAPEECNLKTIHIDPFCISLGYQAVA